MNKVKSFIRPFVAAALLPMFSGCLITLDPVFMPDGRSMHSGVMQSPLLEGHAVTTTSACLFERPITKAEQAAILKDPTTAPCVKVELRKDVSNAVGRDVVTSSTAPIATAAVQGEYNKSAIREQARVCSDGKCPGGGPSVVNNNVLESNSSSAAQAVNDVNVRASVRNTQPACTGTAAGCAGAGR